MVFRQTVYYYLTSYYTERALIESFTLYIVRSAKHAMSTNGRVVCMLNHSHCIIGTTILTSKFVPNHKKKTEYFKIQVVNMNQKL